MNFHNELTEWRRTPSASGERIDVKKIPRPLGRTGGPRPAFRRPSDSSGRHGSIARHRAGIIIRV
jgi:hypothetical protein